MDTAAKDFLTQLTSSLDWSSWVTAIATAVLAGLTLLYVVLTRRILDRQSDPCVVVSVVHDEDRSTVLQLVARNIGSGVAYDIQFSYSRPLPASAWGISVNDTMDHDTMTCGPLIDGIPALGPDETRKIDWGQYGGLKKALANEPIVATCSFRKGNKRMRPTKSILEVSSFDSTVAAQTPVSRIARDIEKVAKELHSLNRSFSQLRAEMGQTQVPDRNDTNEE